MSENHPQGFPVEYEYSRLSPSNEIVIPNPSRLDDNGDTIQIEKEIEIAIPNIPFRTSGHDNLFCVFFQENLSDDQKETLDAIIVMHKINL